MSQQPITVVGDGNIAGNNLHNVGNQIRVQHFYGPKVADAIALLETKVAFDALLNSGARYPPPKCHVDTRKAVQEVVTNWICRRGEWAGKGIMWMSGAPGVGKSAILQTVCEELDTDNGSKSWFAKFGFSDKDVDGSYFFGRGLGDREKASFFPATIAYQLCRSRRSCRNTIKKMIGKRSAILSESFTSQFRQLLINTASKRWSFQSPITIVIDALDECDNVDDRVELLKLIVEAVTTTNMRFLIASRPEQEIHAFFQQKEVSQHTYYIRLDEETFKTSRDIEVFLRDEFARIRRMRPEYDLPLDWPGDTIIIRIRDDSDSQFIFPVLAIAYIDTPFYSPIQQLETLLASPPHHAFSKLDALYERILSRCPPELSEGSDGLAEYQKLVKGILATIISWSEPLSLGKIAEVLDRKVDVVQSIVMGPMRCLFKFDPNNTDSSIMLCHKSLRDCLLDIDRSRRFFVSSEDADTLFKGILSRSLASPPSYSRDDLRSVLTMVVNWRGNLTLASIAGFLDVNLDVANSVVHGPATLLFRVAINGEIQLSSPSLEPFLKDGDRSGEFSMQDEDLDAAFIRILSCAPPPHPYCPDDLLDVLTSLVIRDGKGTKNEIVESLLGVETDLVDHVVHGPANLLFDVDPQGNIEFSTPLLKPFLQDASRSGAFFTRGRNDLDAIYIRILSRQPRSNPSQPYSREVLMGVLTVVMALGYEVDVPGIASCLDVAPSLVEGVIFGPTKALFEKGVSQDIYFSTPSFETFLLDADRAGEYFIGNKVDSLFTQLLSRRAPSNPSQPYSREVLTDVLTVVATLEHRLKVVEIASFLDVAPIRVEDVIFGPAKALFQKDVYQGIYFSAPRFKPFLLDANRSGEYSIPTPDTFLTQLLSRQPSPNTSQPYSRDVLIGVLAIFTALDCRLKVAEIASLLDVAPILVEGVIFGPARALFKEGIFKHIEFSDLSFDLAFLMDVNRAGEYFIGNKVDSLFTQLLSRHAPSNPSQPYSREVLMDVLTAVMALGKATVPQIASLLYTAPSLVEGVIFGPTQSLFAVDFSENVRFCGLYFEAFLLDANRAGEYFIGDKVDTFYTQLLSRRPPSDPSRSYSRKVLIGVLTVVMALENLVGVREIASCLDVAPSIVEGVVSGPTKALFKRDYCDIEFSSSHFKAFLLDVNRAGDFYIPVKDLDTISRPLHVDSSSLRTVSTRSDVA